MSTCTSDNDCFTADWDLVWDQVRTWLLVQVPLVAFSVVLEWLEVSLTARVERLRDIFASPLATFVNQTLQIIASTYVCITWIVRGGAMTVNWKAWGVESALLIATTVGFGTRWIAAKNKLSYVTQLQCIFDLLSVVSHFSLVGQYVVDSNGHLARSWLDFGFLRSYILYAVVDHLFTRYRHKTFMAQILFVIFKACILVFVAASILFSLERLGDLPYTNSFLLHVYQCNLVSDPTQTVLAKNQSSDLYTDCKETWSFFSSIYFMFVTVSTVGYGDFTPKTVLGQIMVCVIIVVGIYTFANESAALITIYGDHRNKFVHYNRSRNTAHVIVTGNPSAAQMKDFIREFFHPDHEAVFTATKRAETAAAAATAEQHTDHTSHPEERLEAGHTNAAQRPKMTESKALASKWMERHASGDVRETHIVILMRFDAEDELETFATEVMAFVQDNPRYRRRVFLIYGSPLRKEDLVSAKLQQAMAVFFLPNKFSNDGNKEDAATVLRVLSVSQQADDHTQLFAMLVNSQNRTLLEAAGLSSDNLVCTDEIRLGLMGLSCRCPGLSTLVSNLITSRSAEFDESSPASALIAPDWAREYVDGASNEIYSCYLDDHFVGMKFTHAAQKIHRESDGEVLLIAVEMDHEVYFNPGHWFRIQPKCKCYMIAESMSKLMRFSGCGATMSGMNAANMTLLRCRQNLMARAHKAQHNVERRLPAHVRDHISRCSAGIIEKNPPLPPSPELLKQGGHIVVCSNAANEGGGVRSIARLVNFLRPLRAPHIERTVPVVIVDAEELNGTSWLRLMEFGEVYHVQGSPQRHQVLVAAGVYTASAVVVLAQGSEAGYDDSKAIFNAILVNSALSRREIFTIIELRDVNNNKFLDPVAHYSSLSEAMEESAFVQSPYQRDTIERSAKGGRSSMGGSPRGSAHPSQMRDSRYQRQSSSFRPVTWIDRKVIQAKAVFGNVAEFFLGNLVTAAHNVRVLSAVDGNMMTFESLVAQDENDTFFQERFMKGALFPSYVADDLLIQSFFNPSLNIFIRKILDGKSCFMLYDIPQELRTADGVRYGELFETMTSSIAHALPIGLLRAKGGVLDAPYQYVYTSPKSSTIVYPNDKVFVIIDVMMIHVVANKLQRRFRNRKRSVKDPITFSDTVNVASRYSNATGYM